MAGQNDRNKNKAMAAFMKAKGIVRDSGACVWGCGSQLRNGGQALTVHLNVCKGPRKGIKR